MKITKFNNKLNYLQNNIYTIEEVLHPVGGVVESVLIHDNIAEDSINVYTGSKLTGDKIKTFVISTPSKAPWTTSIKIFSDLDTVYVTYETKGDTVEADDVNNLQTAVNETQIALNNEVDRATNKETEINNALTAEINRATTKENSINTALTNEVNRAKSAESTLNTNISNEVTRAKNKETEINNALTAEINRATTKENSINTALTNEVNRAKSAESTLNTNISNEVTRAKNKETEINNALTAEINRAKGEESTLKTNLTNEVSRATTRENEINANLTAEINRAKAKESEIDTALSDRYTKSEVFTKSEVLAKIQDLINSAPEVLDTFGEIAEALGNDPNFAATMTTMLSQKVDKVSGKALSTNDFDNTQKSNLADAYNKRHTHDNKSVIDGITSALVSTWNNAYTHISDTVKHITSTERSNWNDANTKKHTHDNKSALDGITSALITNWNNAYSHISDTVKHITSSERTLWNTVTNKVNKSGDTINGHVKVISDANPLSIERNGSPNLSIKFNNVTSASAGTRYLGTYNGTSLRFGDNADLAGAYEVYHTGRKPAKGDVGLGNVDNTSDLNKPISTATQNALNGKANASHTHTKSQITDMPTKLSQFTNDAGYITQAQVDTSQNHTHSNKGVLDKITETNVKTMNDVASGIGGRNLFTGTKDFTGTWIYRSNWSIDSDKYKGFTVLKKQTQWFGLRQKISAVVGEKYVLSAYVKCELGSVINGYGSIDNNITSIDNSNKTLISSTEDATEWRRITFPFTVTKSGDLEVRFENAVNDKMFYICGLKLEKGNIATDWSPAPEDMLKKGCTWNDLKGV